MKGKNKNKIIRKLEESNEYYKKKYDNKIAENYITKSISAIIILIILTIWIITSSNNIDINDLGKYMCNKNGYKLKMAKTSHMSGLFVNSNQSIWELQIICQQKTQQKQIEDGYLILE